MALNHTSEELFADFILCTYQYHSGMQLVLELPDTMCKVGGWIRILWPSFTSNKTSSMWQMTVLVPGCGINYLNLNIIMNHHYNINYGMI